MWFKISGVKNDAPVCMYYNNITNELQDEHHVTMQFDEVKNDSKNYFSFTPDNHPTKRTKNLIKMGIVLGLKCNFHCEYCSQRVLHQKGKEGTVEQVPLFIEMLKRNNIEIGKGHIQIWGGEPLLYKDILLTLIPQLKELYPEAHISFPTNGSLLTKEWVDFFKKYDVTAFVSTDGLPSTARNELPVEENPELNEVFRYAAKEMKGKFGFGVTPHAGTTNIIDIIKNLSSKVPGVKNISVKNIVRVHYTNLPAESFYIDDAGLKEYTDCIIKIMEDPELLKYDLILKRLANQIMYRIASGMDNRNVSGECELTGGHGVIVDLYGNIYECHTKTELGTEVGHIDHLEETPIVGFTHWSHRPNCKNCPYLVSCSGSCASLNDECHALTCRNVKALHKGMFYAVFKRWFGLTITNIEEFNNSAITD